MESQLFTELLKNENVRNVSKIQFGVLSAKEIESASVCDVNFPETYDGQNPKMEGLMDPRMGTSDQSSINPTDDLRTDQSPQYFGSIKMAMPLFYYQFMPMTQKLLKCVCYRCSNLLVNKTDPLVLKDIGKKTKNSRFNIVYKYSQTIKKCEHNDYCNASQPTKYVLLTADKIQDKKNIMSSIQLVADIQNPETKEVVRSTVNPEDVLKIFKRISNSDLKFMGLSPEYFRPESMICEVLPVPPPAVRPSVRQDNNQRAEDDLTHFLMHIVRYNNDLRKKIASNCDKEKIDQIRGALQHMIITYVDNDIRKLPKAINRSGRPMKSLKQRWKGKEGRLRGNIMGKRVDRSARSVISVDPNISIDELGVPIKIAMNLAIDEKVNRYNIRRLTNAVRNGPNKYPGAKTVIKMRSEYKGQSPISIWDLGFGDNAINIPLEEGDVVQRHLVDGDPVIFNRQPSLHRMSIMCHRVRVFPSDTFRLNVFDCAPYNADFDGDEMNMHVPNSLMTQEECLQLMLVSKQVISPAKSRPIITIVQDTLIGAYLLTNPSTTLTREELFKVIMFDKKFNGVIPPPDLTNPDRWYGRTVYSMIIPNITYTDKKTINIENGKIAPLKPGSDDYGRLQSTNLGSSGLIHTIYNMYGSEETKNFMDNTQNLITKWMIGESFSIGFGDILIPEPVIEKNKEIINNAIQQTKQLIRKTQLGKYYPNISDRLRSEQFEAEIQKILRESTTNVQKNIVDTISKNDNSMYESVVSGTKGKAFNLNQIMGLVGQQTVYGYRMRNAYKNRPMPHYPKDDYGAVARGFVKHSFADGLSPIEFYYHTMDSRTGSIDTAINTAESGYISRRLIKSMEDVKVEYDQTIRNANNKIIQFSFGDDNFDPIKLEQQNVKLIEYSDEQMTTNFEWIPSTKWSDYLSVDFKPSKDDDQLLDKEADLIYDLRDRLRTYYKNLDVITAVRVYSPFNPSRIIYASNKRFGGGITKSDITPVFIINKINELLTKINKLFKQKNYALESLIYTYVSSKQIIMNKMNRLSFEYLVDTIYTKTISAIIQPGEMIGIVSAQSLGEPSTQLTLNSVHYDTEILIKTNNDRLIKTKIGEFIDTKINNAKPLDIENHPNDTTLAYLREDIYIPACDVDGKIAWKKILACTQHPVINKDGTNTMLKICTKTGREVIATKGKSLLTMRDNKIVPVNGDEIKIGDRMPVQITNNEDIYCKYKFTNVIQEDFANYNVRVASAKHVHNDIFMDSITEIIEIENTHKYAYDFTIDAPDESKNFNLYNSLCVRDTFHSVGAGGGAVVVTQGVPRFKEILDKTKDIRTSSMNIYLKAPFMKDKEEAKKIASNIVYTKLGDIITNTTITYGDSTADSSEEETFLNTFDIFAEILDIAKPENLSKWILNLEFDKEALLTRKIYMSDIYMAIMNYNSNLDDRIRITYTDDNYANLVLKLNIIEVDTNPIELLRELSSKLLDLTLRGITGIDKASALEINRVKYNDSGEYYTDKEWIVNTSGSNLYDIMKLDEVDTHRTMSNNIIEVMKIFGIEACRSLIIKEIDAVFSGDVSYRHIELLADVMTSKGYIMSINRHGINKSADKDVIAKASFEEVSDILIEAAIFSKQNKMVGTSSNIAMGQLVKGGTNAFGVMIDQHELLDIEQTEIEEEPELIDETEIDEYLDTELKHADVNDNDFNFGFDLETMNEEVKAI